MVQALGAGQQHHDCYPAASEVLLVLHALVGGDQDFVTLLFNPVYQVSVDNGCPTLSLLPYRPSVRGGLASGGRAFHDQTVSSRLLTGTGAFRESATC